MVIHSEYYLGQVCVRLCSQNSQNVKKINQFETTLIQFGFFLHFVFNRNLYGVDTNGLVQRAINASNVYENIVGYIEEANKAALLALNTTNRVKDVSNFHNVSFYFTKL